METVQSIKQRFSIIGNDTGLNRAIEKSRSGRTDRYFGFSDWRKVVLEKKAFLKLFINFRIENTENTLPSIVVPFQKARLIVSFLDMKKAPLQEPLKTVRATLKLLTGEPYFWMKLENFLSLPKFDCYVF